MWFSAKIVSVYGFALGLERGCQYEAKIKRWNVTFYCSKDCRGGVDCHWTERIYE